MDNPEKLATFGYTRHKEKTNEIIIIKKKQHTIYVGHHYTQTNTNNIKVLLSQAQVTIADFDYHLVYLLLKTI